jgi:hypothetical protein
VGRDREYDDNAARQRAYRERLKQRAGRPGAKSNDPWLRKLAKILGLLGSDQMGERAAAALLATKMLKEANKSWYDLLNVKED